MKSNRSFQGPNGCCGYGSVGTKTNGFDCAVIPGAFKASDGARLAGQFCGRKLGTALGTTPRTVCCEFELNSLFCC